MLRSGNFWIGVGVGVAGVYIYHRTRGLAPRKAQSFPVILIPLGVVWAGYLLVWYGAVNLRGSGTGLMDLADPSRIGKVRSALGSSPPSASARTAERVETRVGAFVAKPEGHQAVVEGK